MGVTPEIKMLMKIVLTLSAAAVVIGAPNRSKEIPRKFAVPLRGGPPIPDLNPAELRVVENRGGRLMTGSEPKEEDIDARKKRFAVEGISDALRMQEFKDERVDYKGQKLTTALELKSYDYDCC